MMLKITKKLLSCIGVFLYFTTIGSVVYSQTSLQVSSYKKIPWKKVENERKKSNYLKNMTDQNKYVYIKTLNQSDSFNILAGDRHLPLNELKGGYNDFKYLEEHMMTPVFNYAVSVDNYEYKLVYIFFSGRKEKLKLKLKKNRNFVYIVEKSDGWYLKYSNISRW